MCMCVLGRGGYLVLAAQQSGAIKESAKTFIELQF